MANEATNGPEGPAEETSYAAAAAELDAILDEIESGSVDIDVLARKVERASWLIRVCRQRLAGTELEVTRVIEELEDGTRGDGPACDETQPVARG